MTINLSKNTTISLTKEVDKLSKISVGLGWDVEKAKGLFASFFGSNSIDLDASCLLIDKDKQVIDTIWYRQLRSKCNSVHHQGDNRTGAGEGDDETINIDLNKLPSSVKHIAITVNSFTGQSFENVRNAFCRVIDQSSKEVCRYTLTEQGNHTGIFIGLLTYDRQEWQFTSKGVMTPGNSVKELEATILNHI
ncbi:TerD family protein [Vibrio campbellii]|uniref:TerD family protein n=1 Tax=Vibrio campbellii TaxID=680 RepID=A0ABY5I9Y4_9VIBR|nr:TerD family protein [Vibrio campbellii]UTZ21477.1 TerD family protein [Vibrio campbellii]UTZ31143.1 TerD family protein [Vibrio campbellii]